MKAVDEIERVIQRKTFHKDIDLDLPICTQNIRVLLLNTWSQITEGTQIIRKQIETDRWSVRMDRRGKQHTGTHNTCIDHTRGKYFEPKKSYCLFQGYAQKHERQYSEDMCRIFFRWEIVIYFLEWAKDVIFSRVAKQWMKISTSDVQKRK